MAYRSLARDDVPGLFDNVFEQGLVDSNSFGIFLNFDEHGNRQGQLTLGGYDPTLVDGPFTYSPVVSTEWFVVHMAQIAVADTPVAHDVRVIVDSGTSCLTGPRDIIGPLVDPIRIAHDCTGYATAPNITLNIGGREWTLTPNDYVLHNSQLTSCEVCIEIFDQKPSSPYEMILGDVVQRVIYVHYDMVIMLLLLLLLLL